MTIQVANGTYAESIDGMLMILLSTPFLRVFWVFWVFNPFYNKQLVNILEGSVLLYILFILDTKYSMFNRSKTKSIKEKIQWRSDDVQSEN